MPTTIDGTTGVSQVQSGSIQTADLANGAVTPAKTMSANTSARVACGNTVYLPAGSVIRPHTDGSAQFGAGSQFTITRVS